MIRIWLNSIISNHECASNPIITVSKSLNGWKNMFVFWGSFRFFWGNEILPFCRRSGIHEPKFTPALFQEWYEYFLVQIKCSGCWKVISSYVWCCNIIHLSCYCDKNRTTGISFVSSSIGPNHPISEIATSHVYRLKKTKNESDRVKWKLQIF